MFTAKKHLVTGLMLILLLTLTAFIAQGENITAYGQDIPVDATFIDLGEIQAEDLDALMATLDKLPQLMRVDMFETRLTAEQMDQLAARYPGIFFGWTIRIQEHEIRTDATAFSTLHNNKAPQHTSQDFEPIKYCKHLKALDLGHNAITDISFIKDLKELRVLILAINKIEDISVLSGLPNLEYVELFKNKIKDISPLAGMKNVLDLNICFNYVKDYSPLDTLSSLERLWIYNSNNYAASDPIPKEVVAHLKATHPGCHIDHTHYSTLGGWREHPRYFVIFDIFKNSVYQPFAASVGMD